ncbi:hypothetical protein OS493_036581 [Desmophyllum pertusum]|uniref:TRAF-type domain-containing protein n=1 Tax=Desmophyllum pertusum TaxID=174260 RepID=A0A9X0CDP4_9CNID|nr:hypothetical protein OS493_036581 [Desmophyllum pertusum]
MHRAVDKCPQPKNLPCRKTIPPSFRLEEHNCFRQGDRISPRLLPSKTGRMYVDGFAGEGTKPQTAMSPGTYPLYIPWVWADHGSPTVATAHDRLRHEAQDCPHCGTDLPVGHQADHQRFSCRMAPVVCPFGCDDPAMPREQLNGHIASECRRAHVTCSVPACRESLRRQDLTTHLAQDSTRHIELLMAERRNNQMSDVTPPRRPMRVNTFNWNIPNFERLSDAVGPAEGIKSPLFSSLRTILVPQMSTAGIMGVFLCSEATHPVCLNMSVALRNGSEVILKRSPASAWLAPNSTLGWDAFLDLDEIKRRYVDQNGSLCVQISYQFFD